MTPDPTSSAPPVRHNSDARRYHLAVDGAVAMLDYELAGDRMIFTHTYVPPALRNRGLAAALVRTGLEDARRHRRRVEARCSYVARFLERHPEYQHLQA